jgi:hypothetical protein
MSGLIYTKFVTSVSLIVTALCLNLGITMALSLRTIESLLVSGPWEMLSFNNLQVNYRACWPTL